VSQTLAERIREHQHEGAAIRQQLWKEAPRLVSCLTSTVGSLRGLARESGLSATYLSQVLNEKRIISQGAYLRLVQLLEVKCRRLKR